MMVQAKRMVAVYEQAMADMKAGRKIQVDVSGVKAKVKAQLATQGQDGPNPSGKTSSFLPKYQLLAYVPG